MKSSFTNDIQTPLVHKDLLHRRSILKGIGLFLGLSSIGSLTTSCNGDGVKLPEKLQDQAQELRSFQHLWSVPPAVKELGQECYKTTPNIEELIKNCLQPFDQLVHDKSINESTRSADFAKKLEELHLAAAQQDTWIDIRGWRLTTVEVAAYAICSL